MPTPHLPTIEEARRWYPADDPVHGFDHVLRVYRMAEYLAEVEGADLEIVRAAALLHDATPPDDRPGKPASRLKAGRVQHHQAAAEFAGEVLRSSGWSKERIAAVQHAIRAHRFRDDSEQPQTLEAMVLFDADKLDAIGAIGVARAIGYATQHHQPAYASPSAHFHQSGQTEPDEAHSAYHEYLYKLSKLKDRFYTASGKRLAAERHRRMSVFFEQLAVEMSGNPWPEDDHEYDPHVSRS